MRGEEDRDDEAEELPALEGIRAVGVGVHGGLLDQLAVDLVLQLRLVDALYHESLTANGTTTNSSVRARIDGRGVLYAGLSKIFMMMGEKKVN